MPNHNKKISRKIYKIDEIKKHNPPTNKGECVK